VGGTGLESPPSSASSSVTDDDYGGRFPGAGADRRRGRSTFPIFPGPRSSTSSPTSGIWPAGSANGRASCEALPPAGHGALARGLRCRPGSLRPRRRGRGGGAREPDLSSIGLEAAADTPTAALTGGERNVHAHGTRAHLSERPPRPGRDGDHLDAGARLARVLPRGHPPSRPTSPTTVPPGRVTTRIIELEGGKTAPMRRLVRLSEGELRAAAAQGLDWQADRKRLERLEAVVTRFREIAARGRTCLGQAPARQGHALERAAAEAAASPRTTARASGRTSARRLPRPT
jgi:hypothetical protein